MRQRRMVLFFLVVALLILSYNLFLLIVGQEKDERFQTLILQHQAQSITALTLSLQETYQDIFTKHHIPIDQKTIDLFPVRSMPEIFAKTSQKLQNDLIIRAVSDRPRNQKNLANALEQKTIHYFRNFPQRKAFFKTIQKNQKPYFYYAIPMRITKRCLICHSERSRAPEYIRTHYQASYGYKEGELRGILAIYIAQGNIMAFFKEIMQQNLLTTSTISLLFLGLFYFLIKKLMAKESSYTQSLESEVKKKTQDLEKRKEQLHYQLYHDRLTHLPNRNALIEKVDTKKSRMLWIIDVDNFSEINDFYGHAIGDQLIKQIARALKSYFSDKKGELFHLGGDTFAYLFDDPLDPINHKTIVASIKRLIHYLHDQEFTIDQSTTIHLRIAVGASTHHDDLLATADMAIKKAKNDQRNHFIYDHAIDLSHRYKLNLEWAEKLKSALQDDRIVPYFQPIVHAKSGKVYAYEALMRLIDEDGTVHTPYHFLELAKRTKYYPLLTRVMIDKAIDRFIDLPYHLSLNISYLDIIEKETMDFLFNKLQSTHIADRIHLEILESEGIKRYDIVESCFKRLRSLGCHLSLDDFGSGYSNFEQILKLEIDMLKIDGSLIRNIDQNIGSQIIVETIVDFSKKLKINTCAEFVGSREIAELLEQMGVTYLQGYHLGEPKPDITL